MLYRFPGAVSESLIGRCGRTIERTLLLKFGPWSLAFCALIYAVGALVLLWPGVFFVGVMLNDTLFYADTGYRLALGQVPGLDATSAIGIFTYIPYLLAFHLTHDVVEAIPVSFTIFGVIILALASVLALTRLSAVVGTLVVLACSLVMLAPFVIGYEVPGDVMTTAAMTYNRFCFLLVLLTALLPIEPHSGTSGTRRSIDVAWAIIATTLAYYTKMPLGLAVAGLAGFWLVVMRGDWVGAVLFVLGCALVGLGFETIWPGLNEAYIREMIFAAQAASGIVKPTGLLGILVHTGPEILAIAVAPLIALLLVHRADWRDGLFILLTLSGSLLLLSQSAQGMTLVTPVAVAVIAVTRLSIADATQSERTTLWVALVALIAGLGGLAAPAAVALGQHAVRAERAAPIPGMAYNYRSLRVIDDGDTAALDAAFAGQLDGAQAYAAARTRDQRYNSNALYESEYAHMIAKLTQARNLCGAERDRTAVLDFANVSSSLFGHPPAGAWTYLLWGRSFGPNAFVPAPRMFAGVGCLFDPKLPQHPRSHAGIWMVYGDYLRTHYRVAGETPYWRVLVIATKPDATDARP